MSDDWRTEMALQNDHLRAQLAALRKGPASRWRRFRLHEVVCGGCGETLVEVMDTKPYPVVLSSETAPTQAQEEIGPDATPAERMAASVGRMRRGERRWFPIADPQSQDDDQLRRGWGVFTVCRCRQVTLDMVPIVDALRRGEPKRVLRARNVLE